MNIIHIMDGLGAGGGVNSFVFDLCIELSKLGHAVTIIGIIDRRKGADDQINALQDAGVSVLCVGAKSRKEAPVKFIGKLRSMIKKVSGETPTVCNMHLKLSVLMGTVATLGMKYIYCVETYHGSYSKYLLEYSLLKKKIKKYFCVSLPGKEEMIQRFRTAPNKIVVAPNGISREDMRKKYSKQILTKSHGQITAISIGRLSYEKNILTTINGFADICNPDVDYYIIGDGPQKEECQMAAKNNPHIHFTGMLARSRAMEYLVSSDIVVMPSLWEGLSITMLEAMAFDKPLILSDALSFRSFFKEPALEQGELFRVCPWGYLVSTNNAQGYKKALVHFVENVDIHSCMSEIVKRYSIMSDISTTAHTYEKTYKELLY